MAAANGFRGLCLLYGVDIGIFGVLALSLLLVKPIVVSVYQFRVQLFERRSEMLRRIALGRYTKS